MTPRTPARATAPKDRGAYRTSWLGVALVVVAAFSADAVLHASPLPLLVVTGGVAILGGIIAATDPLSTSRGRHQFLTGLLVAGAVGLAAAGVGHHLTLGMTLAAVLLASSPDLINWVRGQRSDL